MEKYKSMIFKDDFKKVLVVQIKLNAG
jgi:hypothetical protein